MRPASRQRGFSLIEISIVLIIVVAIARAYSRTFAAIV